MNIQESELESHRRKEAKRTHLHYGVKERRAALAGEHVEETDLEPLAHTPVEVLPEPSAPVEAPAVVEAPVEPAPEAPVASPVAQ